VSQSNGEQNKKKWWNRMPHTYVILFMIVVAAALLTWILPAGEYTREAVEGVGRPIVVQGSYHEVEAKPTSFFQIFTAIPKGMSASASIIFIIILSTGAFTVINKTGALENGIGVFLRRLNKSKVPGTAVIWIMTFLFASLGLIVGPEIQIPFTLIGVSIALGLGYDLIVGLAMVMAGGYMGWAMGPINASIIGTAHSIVGLPAFSGFGFRMILWFATTCVVSLFISLYAKKIKKDPTKSIVYGINTDGLGFEKGFDEYAISGKHIRVLVVLLAMFIAIVVGASKYGWYLDEMSAIFIIGGLAAGYAYGLKTQQIIDGFMTGASNTASIALVVGIARAIQIVLENGKIMDTIINGISEPLSALSPTVAAIGISIVTAIVHFFIPSGSGLTVTMMPILSPLGEILNITQQSTVLAMQAGATIPNIILPTVGATIAMCGLARVPFEKWVKFATKIVLAVFVVSWIFIFIAIKINYGPF
jgi:uncharacterized ion transporter superfamily protein YfcC